jgi:hypothetical protein
LVSTFFDLKIGNGQLRPVASNFSVYSDMLYVFPCWLTDYFALKEPLINYAF